MGEKVILVVDFGTSNVHVNAVKVSNGEIICSTSQKYPMISPEDGYTEVDANLLWQNSETCVGDVIENLGENQEIAAITFSYFGDNLILADKDGEALYNCILCFDIRGEKEAEYILSRVPEKEILEMTGSSYSGFATGSKILWVKKNMPEIYKKTAYFYTNQQFINHKLGLPPVNDYTMACRKSLYDIRSRKWAKPLLDVIGVKEEQLGDVVGAWEVIGTITRYGHVELPYEVPVLAGCHDCDCGMVGLGIGNEEEDAIADITGTYDHLGYLANGAVNMAVQHPDEVLGSYCGPLENTSVCLGAFPTSGALLEWFMREINGDTSQCAYRKLWEMAVFDGSGSLAVIPTFANNEGAFLGLGLTKTRTDLFEGIIEALTYECRRILESCATVKQGGVHRIRIGGGAANSDVWMQLRADISGKRVERTQNIEVSSLGAAIIAAVSVGIYGNIQEAVQAMVHVRDVFEPREHIFKRYNQKYREYIEKSCRKE